jgi:membrane-bound metal-dependent hydrolase YbcI (DUF457 family)
MFAGHAFLAFALVGAVVAHLADRETAVRLGVLAAAFAAIPDVDMSYALVGLLSAEGGALSHASAFWEASTVVHRTITHSLVVAPAIALLAACWVGGRRRDARTLLAFAVAVGLSLVAVAATASGPLGGFVMGVFVVAALAVAEATVQHTTVSARTTGLVGLVGLLSHPFGDLFTGEPPALLYPFDVTVFAERVTLAADPTLHLLGAFAVELAAIWAGVVVATHLLGRSPLSAVDLRAGAGLGYAAAVLVIPAPTLDLSYPFVFSVLLVGAVGVVPRFRIFDRQFERPDATDAFLTGLAAVTAAGLAYAFAYLFVLG